MRVVASLNLHVNSIGEKGAAALAEALKTNMALTSLYVYGNSIGDKGARVLAGALKTNQVLTSLNVAKQNKTLKKEAAKNKKEEKLGLVAEVRSQKKTLCLIKTTLPETPGSA